VSDGRSSSSRTDSRGKYAFPSTVTMSSDSAMTVPFQVAVAMPGPSTVPDRLFRVRRPTHQRSGCMVRDSAVWQARQWPHVTSRSGTVGSPHSGHSTVSAAWARASLMSFERSSWIVSSPRQGQPR
jgi:hypothetical protein